MSNPFVPVQTQEQGDNESKARAEQHYLTILAGLPGFPIFAQPASSNPTYGQIVDNSPWNADNFDFPLLPNFGFPELPPDSTFHSGHNEPIPFDAQDFEFPPLPDFWIPELSPDSSFHSGNIEPIPSDNAHDFKSPPRPDSGVPKLSPDVSIRSGHIEPEKDGPGPQVGHYCRLPTGQMEWVHNQFLPRDADFGEGVGTAIPPAQDSTSHVAKEGVFSSRRSLLASVFKERMRIRRERRSRASKIHSASPQANPVANGVEDLSDRAENSYYKVVKDLSSALSVKRPSTRLDRQPIQHIPVKPSEYQNGQHRVSKKPKRQIRETAPVARMETLLEEAAESPAVAQPANGLILPVMDEDQNSPMHEEFVDEGFVHANGLPAPYAPSDPNHPPTSPPPPTESLPIYCMR